MMRLLGCSKWYGGSKSTPTAQYKIVRSGQAINLDHRSCCPKSDKCGCVSHLGRDFGLFNNSGGKSSGRTTGNQLTRPPKPSPYAGSCWHRRPRSTTQQHSALRSAA